MLLHVHKEDVDGISPKDMGICLWRGLNFVFRFSENSEFMRIFQKYRGSIYSRVRYQDSIDYRHVASSLSDAETPVVLMFLTDIKISVIGGLHRTAYSAPCCSHPHIPLKSRLLDLP